MKKMKVDAMCQTYSFLENGTKFYPVDVLHKNNEENIAFYANILCISKKQLDYHIIINYMNEIMDSKSELYKHMYNKTKHNKIDNVFKYDVDEYFLNYIIYYYFVKNSIKILYVKEYYILNYITQIYSIYKKIKIIKNL